VNYRVPFVDYRKQYLGLKPQLDAAISRTLGEGNLILRDDVREFEAALARFIGVQHAVGLNSGTDALIFAMRALRLGPGDEVITVAHTFLATIAAIVHVGATPVLVDVGADYLIDPTAVERALTRRTRAIIPVHLNGRVCDMEGLSAVIPPGVAIIEDAAQALGAKLNGRAAGTFGVVSCFSFYPAKMLGAAADAGAACTDDPDLALTIRHLRDHGREGKVKHVLYGFTSRLDNLQAAVLNAKFPCVPAWIHRRRALAEIYDDGLSRISGLSLPPRPDAGHSDTYQNYVVRSGSRDALADHLHANGVETIISNPIPLHKQPGLGLDHFDLPVTEKLSAEVISLPLVPELDDDQVRYAVDAVRSFDGSG